MIPVGYMLKRVRNSPAWLGVSHVDQVYSVSSCISENFRQEWMDDWKHNGYWFFNDPETLEQLLVKHGISKSGLTLFFYYLHEEQWLSENRRWVPISPFEGVETRVVLPAVSRLCGYDIVTLSDQSFPECLPLSCNGLCRTVDVNSCRLLGSLENAIEVVEGLSTSIAEPGPYGIYEVYKIGWFSE